MEERRSYQRLDLTGYTYDCCVQINGEEYYAKLLDVSQGGARLQLQADYNQDMRSGKFKEEVYKPSLLSDKDYSVVWNYGKDIGVSFKSALQYSNDDMKRYYSHGEYRQMGYYPQSY